jgi:hypothetical protein
MRGTVGAQFLLAGSGGSREAFLEMVAEKLRPDMGAIEAVKHNLALTPEERLERHRRACQSIAELREARESARSVSTRKSA